MLLQSGHKITLNFIFCYQNKRDRLSSSEPSCFHQLLDKEPHSAAVRGWLACFLLLWLYTGRADTCRLQPGVQSVPGDGVARGGREGRGAHFACSVQPASRLFSPAILV